jgi:hypothetical protein
MPTWRYALKSSISKLTPKELNAYGDKGWELVSVVYVELVGFVYYFKKELKV